MSYPKKPKKAVIWGFGIVLAVSVCMAARAEEEQPAGGSGIPRTGESLPSYKGEGSIYLGFRWVENDMLTRAAEYEEEDSSVALGAEAIACPLPHRYHLHGDYLGNNSYFADFGYAYRDIVLFRNILVGVHHNLDHYNYLYPDNPPPITYDERSPGENNFVDFTKNESMLRLKAPDYPLHSFVKYRYILREGALEERFLIGDFDNLVKTSESRDIDWKAKDLTIGANSHLGPIEVEFTHNRTEFDPGANAVLFDLYPPSSIFNRPGDVYPHNVIPETESSANSVKLHTSYTGQIVASATLSNGENTNNYSGAESETWKAAFDLRWIPDPAIGLFFKYRHRDRDKDNPAQVTLAGHVNRNTYTVRPLISTIDDVFSLSTRYRPLNNVTLIGKYEFEHRQRKDIDQWAVLPEESDIHHVSLTAHAAPLPVLKLKAAYDFENHQDPAYNTEPDYLNKLRLNATYTPAPWVTAFLNYSLALTRRDDLRYLNNDPFLLLEDGERDGQTDNFLGSLSFVLSPAATVTASWSYNRWKIEQDLAYALWNESGTGGDLPFYDRHVPYTDDSNTFSLSLYYMIRQDLTLSADLSYTIAEGEYLPGNIIPSDPAALTSFSEMETEETILTVELAKKLWKNWEAGLKFHADFYDDEFSGQSADHQDGEVFVTTLTLKRYF